MSLRGSFGRTGPGPRIDGWTMPRSKTKRDRLAQVFSQDVLALCRAAWSDTAPAWVREIEAVTLLRPVLMQTFTIRTDARGREVIKKWDADDDRVPPGHIRLASPYDPDARWSTKGGGGECSPVGSYVGSASPCAPRQDPAHRPRPGRV